MPPRKPVKKIVPTPATLDAETAARLLRKQCDRGHRLINALPVSEDDEKAWLASAREVLSRAFGSDSPNIRTVLEVGAYQFAFGGGNEQAWMKARENNLKTRINILEGLIDVLDSETGDIRKVADSQLGSPVAPIWDSVFIVHGHNEATLNLVARFLELLSLKVIILRELPNSGRTIIEKFVEYSNVGFAVVLLTADDRGGSKELTYQEQNFRARQNVILELGFFLGKIGRDKVCALYEEGVEIPSDYEGVVFVSLDSRGSWHVPLARELRAAGFEIDMNKLL